MIQKSSATTELIELGNVDVGAAGRVVVQIVATGWTGSLTPKARVTGSSQSYVPIAYRDLADGAVKTAALTVDALIEIDAPGLDIALEHTCTAGAVTLYALPVVG